MTRSKVLSASLQVSTDKTITYTDLGYYGEFILTQAGVRLTAPTPGHQYLRRGFRVQNITSGYQTFATTSGYMIDGGESVLIPPYGAISVKCIQNGSGASAAYYWACEGQYERSKMREIAWNPTVTWGTGTPSPISQTAKAFIVGPFCYGFYKASGTDGNGATSIAVPLPTRPADINAFLACEGYVEVDGTPYDLQPYIDMLDNTATNRYLKSNNFTTLTDAKAWTIVMTFWYELEGGDIATFTPTLTWGTATPASVTTVARFANLDGVIHVLEHNSSADANGVVSSLTTTLATGILDLGTYVPLSAYDIVTAGDDSVDYDNMLFLLDCNHATEANRVATSNAIGVAADGKSIITFLSGIYEQIGWSSWTPAMTFTGTAPTAAANVGRYKIVDGMCYFNAYFQTADGNGVTGLEISNLPVDPAYLGCEIALCSMETVNTTDSDPLAYIPANEQASSARAKIKFKNFATMTDGVASYMYIAGYYPVG